VQVNSLEQLIDINQNLSTALGTSSTTAASASPSSQAAAQAAGLTGSTLTGSPSIVQPAAQKGSALGNVQAAAAGAHRSGLAAGSVGSAGKHAKGLAPGNLSVPATKPAANRVGHSLDGQPHIP
jgi:hypothetical protein